eukprot:366190-Chlamydomonas_euryale.AAC.10
MREEGQQRQECGRAEECGMVEERGKAVALARRLRSIPCNLPPLLPPRANFRAPPSPWQASQHLFSPLAVLPSHEHPPSPPPSPNSFRLHTPFRARPSPWQASHAPARRAAASPPSCGPLPPPCAAWPQARRCGSVQSTPGATASPPAPPPPAPPSSPVPTPCPPVPPAPAPPQSQNQTGHRLRSASRRLRPSSAARRAASAGGRGRCRSASHCRPLAQCRSAPPSRRRSGCQHGGGPPQAPGYVAWCGARRWCRCAGGRRGLCRPVKMYAGCHSLAPAARLREVRADGANACSEGVARAPRWHWWRVRRTAKETGRGRQTWQTWRSVTWGSVTAGQT